MLASLLQPVLEGVLTFLRRNAGQQMGYLNIFVQIGPVNAFTVADEMPVCPLFGGTMQQPGEPGQWNANGAVVFQRDDQFFVGNLYLSGTNALLNHQSMHARRLKFLFLLFD